MTSVRIAILQAPAPDFARAEAAWQELLARVDDAAEDEPDLVVLPEASYPAWFLGAAAGAPPVIPDAQLIAGLAERAQRHAVHIAAGLVLGRPGQPQNAAVLISPDGIEIARTAEFQPAPWFHGGQGPAVTTLQGSPVALFAGLDHLDPRWVEAVAGAQAQLIIATGAARGWTHGGGLAGDPADAILAARAAETGAWVAASGRTGVEADAVGYAGGAGVISPRTGWAVRAPADRPGIVLHEVDLTPPQPGVALLPTGGNAGPTASGTAGTTRTAALALDPSPSVVELMESVRAAVRAAAALGAQLVVLPDLTGADPRAVTRSEILPVIEEVSGETGTAVVASAAERAEGQVYRSVAVVESGRLLAHHRQAALSEVDRAVGFQPGRMAPPVVETRAAGRLGLLAGREGLAPAAAAALRRAGAQHLIWSAGHTDRLVSSIAQSRAWEQGLPVTAAGTAAGGACIAAAGGELRAVTRPGTPMLTHALVERRATS